MIVLGIETSCDETAAAIVDDERNIRADVVLSQLDDHRPHGGVVPEVAARAHLRYLDGLIRRALDQADLSLDQIDAVAATGGPGLIGGVIVGTMTAKALALALEVPFVAVNHLEGHALVTRLTGEAAFPNLLFLASGGHCQLLSVAGVGDYERLGTTIDDAAGEAFDKTAKLLGLGYPGGPAIERAALRSTDPDRFELPRPMIGRPGCDFSFSGLKTAARRHVDALGGAMTEADKIDLAAAFQRVVVETAADRAIHAIEMFRGSHPEGDTLVLAGGVAANKALRAKLEEVCARRGFRLVAPPIRLCTDNAVMIAWAGIENLKLGRTTGLDFAPRPRWPLDPRAAPKIGRAGVGSGVKV